jgi:hypothetical protein
MHGVVPIKWPMRHRCPSGALQVKQSRLCAAFTITQSPVRRSGRGFDRRAPTHRLTSFLVRAVDRVVTIQADASKDVR